MEKRVEEKRAYRENMNEKLLASSGKTVRRFFALDQQAYSEGVIPVEYKELMGLTASLVQRCDDCIFYHMDRCVSLGVTEEELDEAFGIALIIGGSTVIPHLRRAREILDEILAAREE